jgi:hypothetical protein
VIEESLAQIQRINMLRAMACTSAFRRVVYLPLATVTPGKLHMSVTYDNELVLIGAPGDINNVLPGLVEQGWWITDRDRLCVKLAHDGAPLGIPAEVATNTRLVAALYCLEVSYNSIDLETSALGFRAHEHQRGLQGPPGPCFGGLSDHEITEVTPEMAIEIARYDGKIWLCVTELSPEAAGLLAEHTSLLSLTGIKSLTPEIARELAKHRGPLELDRLVELPLEVAREFAASSATLSFGRLASVDPEAIQALAAGTLHPEYGVEFGSRTRQFGDLKLSGLTQITPELARAIATHPRNICLNGLQELSPEVARELAADRQGFLELRGVVAISEESARFLGSTSAGLILSGIQRLTPGAAAGLAQAGGGLFLNGLRFLSVEVAQALATHRGHLGLLGVTQADEGAIEALAKHDGPVVLGIGGGVTLKNGRSLGCSAPATAAEPSECGRRAPDYFGENRPFSAARFAAWRDDFLHGKKSLKNSDWLEEHLGRQLLGAGMLNRDACEVAEMLRDDILCLLLARDAAKSELSQLEYLEEHAEWRRRRDETALQAAGPESAG